MELLGAVYPERSEGNPRPSRYYRDAPGKSLMGEDCRLDNGGADGIRTHDLLDAIEARSQLRHGPTAENGCEVYNIGHAAPSNQEGASRVV